MEKFNKALLFFGIILIIGLIIYFYTEKREDSYYYNGYKIYKTPYNFYNIEIYFKNDQSPHYLASRYDPNELEYIEIELDIKNKVLKDEIFITLSKNLSSTSVIALAEITKVTSNQYLYNIPTKGALTYFDGKNIQKNCNDASSEVAVILLRLGGKTRILADDQCVILEGTDEDELIKAATRLTLTTLGVMK